MSILVVTQRKLAIWSIHLYIKFVVNINCQCQRGPDVFPFGGRKDSAEGTLSVHDALRAFSIRSMIAAKQTDDSKGMLASMVSEHYSKFVNTDFIF